MRSVELLVLSAWIWSVEAVVLSSHCRVSLYLDVPSCFVCEHPISMHAAYVQPIKSQPLTVAHLVLTCCPLPVGKLAMGDLAEALKMVAATYGLDVFNDEDGSNFSLLVDSLSAMEIASCADFRLAFVSSDDIDDDTITGFAQAQYEIFHEVIRALATELIPEGGYAVKTDNTPPLKKLRPTVNVGGRLVYRSLAE